MTHITTNSPNDSAGLSSLPESVRSRLFANTNGNILDTLIESFASQIAERVEQRINGRYAEMSYIKTVRIDARPPAGTRY